MSLAIDLLLISTLGLLGSFGHCAGMCGPLAISFTLSSQNQKKWLASFKFHFLLNLGRVISYGIVGMILGSFGSLLFTTQLRQIMGFVAGLLLMWLGLSRILPQSLPKMPVPILKTQRSPTFWPS